MHICDGRPAATTKRKQTPFRCFLKLKLHHRQDVAHMFLKQSTCLKQTNRNELTKSNGNPTPLIEINLSVPLQRRNFLFDPIDLN